MPWSGRLVLTVLIATVIITFVVEVVCRWLGFKSTNDNNEES